MRIGWWSSINISSSKCQVGIVGETGRAKVFSQYHEGITYDKLYIQLKGYLRSVKLENEPLTGTTPLKLLYDRSL